LRFSPGILDEIRARLPVSRVVARRVKLKRAGREYAGLSPFKQERTPSFTVNDQKGLYHCFASGEHGDVFTFLMKVEGLSFPEAVERLAAEAGVHLPDPTPKDREQEDRTARLRAACEEACAYFERTLAGSAGEAARAYLRGRGVSGEEIRAFRLGYAPASRNALKDHLGKANYREDEMIEAGLLIHGEDISTPYDRFRDRLIFPIRDRNNRIIAFGGRALSPGQQPKYLNSPETPLFHKGHTLYNFAAARSAAHDRQQLLVAEGYMDVIALTRAGFPNAVAPLGTALTIEQIKLVWSVAPEPALCFDGDSAGRKAAFRAIDIVLPHLEPGRSLRFVFLPQGQDPDDLVRMTGGVEKLAALAAEAQPLIDVLWLRESSAHPLSTPEQRAAFEERLRALAGAIGHAGVKYHYLSSLREKLKLAFPFAGGRQPHQRHAEARGRAGGGRGTWQPRHPRSFAAQAEPSPALSLRLATESSPREALIVTALLNHPWLVERFADDIATLPFENEDHERLCTAILAAELAYEPLDKTALELQLVQDGCGDLLRRLGESLTHQSDQQFLSGTPEADVIKGWNHVSALQRHKVALKREIEDAERAWVDSQTDENFERLRLLKQQAEHISCA
jgi:DNA primase